MIEGIWGFPLAVSSGRTRPQWLISPWPSGTRPGPGSASARLLPGQALRPLSVPRGPGRLPRDSWKGERLARGPGGPTGRSQD